MKKAIRPQGRTVKTQKVDRRRRAAGIDLVPAGILASGFAAEIQKRDHPGKRCPHCGEQIEE